MRLLPLRIQNPPASPKAFFRFSFAGKMLLGYMTLVVLTVGVVLYVLLSLYQLNKLNNEVVRVNIPAQEIAEDMFDMLVAQDTYEKRYLILREKNTRALFWGRAEEFKVLLSRLEKLPRTSSLPLKLVKKLHTQYNDIFMREVELVKAGDLAGARDISSNELRALFDQLAGVLRSMSAEAQLSQDATMRKISSIGGEAYYTTALLCLLALVLGALAGILTTRQIVSSINKLRVATMQIAEGNFHYDPGITSNDEIGDLAQAFVSMGKRLKKLEEMYLDASPLTRLPGGVVVESVMNSRLQAGKPIAFCVMDMDNFKVFNDHYGYARGNEVIKEVAKILDTAVKTKGTSEDFLGHIDGDDFVLITTPSRTQELCSEIIRLFDERIRQFYSASDLAAGFITGKTRQGQEMQFPIMTFSIAVVTNEYREFANTLEASSVAAELKDYAKTIPSSVFVVDKRRSV